MQNSIKRNWIALEGMQFYAHHGVTEEERKVGGEYEVNIFLGTFFENAMMKDQLELTIDYEVVFESTKKIMAESSKLIEHVAGKILNDIKSKYNRLFAIKIEVIKKNPPLNGEVDKAKVVIEETFG